MNIRYGEVESYCNEMHAIAIRMRDILNRAAEAGKNISNRGEWQGMAAEYYQKKLDTLIKGFDEIFEEMENSILYMAKVSGGYQMIDRQIMQEICTNLNINNPTLSNSQIYNR